MSSIPAGSWRRIKFVTKNSFWQNSIPFEYNSWPEKKGRNLMESARWSECITGQIYPIRFICYSCCGRCRRSTSNSTQGRCRNP